MSGYSCPTLVAFGWCTTGSHTSNMQDRCLASCNNCTTTAPTMAPTIKPDKYYNCNTENVMCSQLCRCVVELLLQVPCVVCDDGDAERNLLMVAGSGVVGLVATVFAGCLACGPACSVRNKPTKEEVI